MVRPWFKQGQSVLRPMLLAASLCLLPSPLTRLKLTNVLFFFFSQWQSSIFSPLPEGHLYAPFLFTCQSAHAEPRTCLSSFRTLFSLPLTSRTLFSSLACCNTAMLVTLPMMLRLHHPPFSPTPWSPFGERIKRAFGFKTLRQRGYRQQFSRQKE